MIVDPIWTQEDIDALKAAIRTGVLSVRYDGPPGRTIVYQSLEAMRALLAEMVSQVGNAAETRSGYRVGRVSKGL